MRCDIHGKCKLCLVLTPENDVRHINITRHDAKRYIDRDVFGDAETLRIVEVPATYGSQPTEVKPAVKRVKQPAGPRELPDSQPDPNDPAPDEIAAVTSVIRSEWDEETMWKRKAVQHA